MDYSSSSANSSANRSGATGEALSLRPDALRVAATPSTGADIFAEHLARAAKDRAHADDAQAMAPGQRRERDTAQTRRDETDGNRANQTSRKKDSESTDKSARSGDADTGPQDASAPADDSVTDANTDSADATKTDGEGDKAASADKSEAKSGDDGKKVEDEPPQQDDTAAQAAAVDTPASLEKTTTKGDPADGAMTAEGKAAAPLTPEEKKAALQAAGKAGSADAPPQKGDATGDKTADASTDGKAAEGKPADKAADKAAAQALANAETQTNGKAATGDGKDDLAISEKGKKGLGHEAAQKLAETKSDAARNQPTANTAATGQAGHEHAKTAASTKADAAAAPQQRAQGTSSNNSSATNDLLTGVPASGARGNGASPTVRIGTLPGQTQPTQLPASALAIQMARNLNKGVDRFEIRLDPPEMGRIDVKMEVHKDGRVSAHMMADKQDTLDLLQRDQRALQQALQNADLDADNSSLSFSLRDQNPDGGSAFAGNGNDGAVGGTDTADGTEDLIQAPVYNVNIAANGGVDIRI